MDSITLAYPLCVSGDTVNNPNGCLGVTGMLDLTTFEKLSNLRLFPNPNKGVFTIRMNQPTKGYATATIYNITGEIILTQELKNSRTEELIDMKGQAKGVYFVEVRTEEGFEHGKLIIE